MGCREGCGTGLKHPHILSYNSLRAFTHKKRGVLYLLDPFEASETPVLIHCAAGVDRSGLACVLWMMVMEGQPKKEARKQLSFWKGHLSSWDNTGEVDQVFFSCFSSGGGTGKSALL